MPMLATHEIRCGHPRTPFTLATIFRMFASCRCSVISRTTHVPRDNGPFTIYQNKFSNMHNFWSGCANLCKSATIYQNEIFFVSFVTTLNPRAANHSVLGVSDGERCQSHESTSDASNCITSRSTLKSLENRIAAWSEAADSTLTLSLYFCLVKSCVWCYLWKLAFSVSPLRQSID
jgi:hypothetical protein